MRSCSIGIKVALFSSYEIFHPNELFHHEIFHPDRFLSAVEKPLAQYILRESKNNTFLLLKSGRTWVQKSGMASLSTVFEHGTVEGGIE